jgi:eukaryotic-like serine/threonine-protein kinase
MNTCDRTICRRLLEGELSSAEESDVLHHLDDCPRCQAWLEQDAGDDAAWSATRDLLGSSPELPHWPSSHAGAVTQSVVRDSDGAPADAVRHPPVDISFLAPSDDPAYLGRIGAYEIAGVIGFGGMGVVLKAVDRSLSRYVAIKVLSPALSHTGAARQRFAREARAMAALSHEHVVPIYAVDEHRGLPYFAMEYVPGGTLQARLGHEGPLDILAIVRIAMQTALALEAAHDSGLVHRDIKPANILLDRGVERVRVADFGLARTASEASYTASGVLAGTPQFMSPEQVRGESCDGRSDLFSLGSVAYAMCTGHEPFRAEHVYGVLQRIVHDQPRSIREQNPNVPAWLEQFVGRLMAKDCGERFQSAAEVAALLERELAHLQNPTLGPAPPRPWMRDSKRVGRTAIALRAVAALASVSIVATAVFLSTTSMSETPQPHAEPQPTAEPEPSSSPGNVFIAIDSTLPSVSSVPALPRATAPMWNADGLDRVRAYADALEQQAFAGGADPLADPWGAELNEMQRRMLTLVEPPLPAEPPNAPIETPIPTTAPTDATDAPSAPLPMPTPEVER